MERSHLGRLCAAAGGLLLIGAVSLVPTHVAMAASAATIKTTASGGGPVGTQVSDTAKLSNFASPTNGTLTFNLYGPSPSASCTGANDVFTSTVSATGNGSFPSGTFITTTAGTYRWIVTYTPGTSADTNAPAAGKCTDAGESVTITAAAGPSISTQASGSGSPVSSTNDTATLQGFTGTINGTLTFNLYGPGAGCVGTGTGANNVFTSTAHPTANGSFTSDSFTPTTNGTYHWIVTYTGGSGDSNAPAAGTCTDAGESVTIGAAAPPQPTGIPGGGACTPGGPNPGGGNLGGGNSGQGNLGHGNQGDCNVGDGNETNLNAGDGNGTNPPEDE